MTRTLLIFVKEPLPGRVKTRLGRGIGLVASARWFRIHVARLIRRLGRDPRWQTVLAVSPDITGLSSRVWPASLARWPQGRGDLGDRMARAFRAMPTGPVVIVGGDIPGISPAHIEQAFRALGHADAVFGPADDGGYWLVGLKRVKPIPHGFMQAVRWSSDDTLADTLATIPDDWRITTLGVLNDVDTVDDLRAWEAERGPISTLAPPGPLL